MNLSSASILIDQILTCACEALATEGAGPVCWCGMTVSGTEATWDFCGECSGRKCGMGYVRLVSIFGYTTFPQPDPETTCSVEYGLSLEVGALRCLPVMDESGEPPSESEMKEVTLAVMADAFALREAVSCCVLTGNPKIVVQSWEAVGPAGGCVGGKMAVFISDV